HLIAEAEKAIGEVDLSEGKIFLSENWGRQSLCDWARFKFGVKIDPGSLVGKEVEEIRNLFHDAIMAAYRQKEIEFPVQMGMARFMADRAQAANGAHRYDREGLYHWAKERFGPSAAHLSEEEFRTQSRAKLHELVLDVSRQAYPRVGQEQIDARLEEALSGTKHSEPDDARELVEWARTELGLEVSEAELTGITEDAARKILWNAFDNHYRPEMRGMERSLLLSQLD